MKKANLTGLKKLQMDVRELLGEATAQIDGGMAIADADVGVYADNVGWRMSHAARSLRQAANKISAFGKAECASLLRQP